jgi:hypothetical protein
MGVFTRPDSPYFYLYLEPIGEKESTDIRRDARTPEQRKDNKQRAIDRYHARLQEIADGPKPDAKPERLFREQAAWYALHVLPTHKGKEREMGVRGEGDRQRHRARDRRAQGGLTVRRARLP